MSELSKDKVDALLREWALEGKDEALEELFPVYFRKVVNILRREEGHRLEDGEDLVQEVFAQLHRWLKAGHEPPRKLTLYLLSSARTLAKNWGRRKKLPQADAHEVAESLPEISATSRTLLSTFGSLEVRNILQEAIERLPDCWRQVYVLRLEGLKEREIAERTGLSLGTVKAYIHQGLERLKEDLDHVARQMSTWFAQRDRGELTPVTILQASQKIPWCYGDPVRLKHFERLPDEEGARKLEIPVDVYRARLQEGYELLENELAADVADILSAIEKAEKKS